MKKHVILMVVMMLMIIPSVAMADSEDEKAGRLFLFQKCDDSGCPTIQGPWPILPGSNRSGKLQYSLWGDKFKFSFSGRGLTPATNYTLIYYPDPWPGDSGLICLGSGQSTPDKPKGKGKGKSGQKGGNIEIHGKADIKTNLPASYDANYIPTFPSGAVGAKIWLVLSADVECKAAPYQMVNWNPGSYLFEYNLITFEYRPGDDEEDD